MQIPVMGPPVSSSRPITWDASVIPIFEAPARLLLVFCDRSSRLLLRDSTEHCLEQPLLKMSDQKPNIEILRLHIRSKRLAWISLRDHIAIVNVVVAGNAPAPSMD